MPREFFQFSTIASSCCSSDTGKSEFKTNRFNVIIKRNKKPYTNNYQLQGSSKYFNGMADPIYQIKDMKISNKAPTNLANATLRLENVQAHNLEVDIGDSKISASITLRYVPRYFYDCSIFFIF